MKGTVILYVYIHIYNNVNIYIYVFFIYAYFEVSFQAMFLYVSKGFRRGTNDNFVQSEWRMGVNFWNSWMS